MDWDYTHIRLQKKRLFFWRSVSLETGVLWSDSTLHLSTFAEVKADLCEALLGVHLLAILWTFCAGPLKRVLLLRGKWISCPPSRFTTTVLLWSLNTFLHLLLTFPCDMCQSCCWTLSEVVCVWCGGLSRCLNHDLFAFPPYVSSFSLFFLLSVCVCFCVSDECQTRLVNHWFM